MQRGVDVTRQGTTLIQLWGDQRRFWCQLKKHTGLGKKKSSTIPMEVLDGQRVVTNKEEVVEKWRKDFATLLEAKEDFISHSDASEANKDSQADCISSGGSEGTWDSDDAVNDDIVNWALLGLKNNKGAGPDGLPAEVLKNEVCITFFQNLFPSCLKSMCIPSVWRHGTIVPIPKNSSSDPRIPLNYRGISLLCIPYKAFCTIINQHIFEWSDETGILCEEQNGFRSNRSCLEHIFSLLSVVELRMQSKMSTFGCFIVW